ncbi:MAG: hypothetical protein HW380_2272, partial [Magnetococcales bacterium]|nr:hypothetical protein [Magnetococcales bacterium]
NFCGGPGGIIPPGGGLEAAAHKVFLLILTLILILILLPPKGGLGAQPQGFDFVSLPEGHHVQRSMLAHIGHPPLAFQAARPSRLGRC